MRPRKILVSFLVRDLARQKREKFRGARSLAVCLTIRQNELRLGRQQISSQREGAFGVRLFTSLADSLVDVEGESEKRSDGRSKRGTEVTDA